MEEEKEMLEKNLEEPSAVSGPRDVKGPMTLSKKPTKKLIRALDWNECTEFIEKKHGIDTRDYARSHTQFDEWADGKGYGQTDPEGKTRGSSQKWFAEFQADIKSGMVVERPYQDFWHFILDQLSVSRGGYIELDEELGEGAKPWQQEILALYLSEFGEGPYHTDW